MRLCQWDWEKAGCLVARCQPLPRQSPPVWMKKAESGIDPPFTPLPTPQEPERREGREDFEHTSKYTHTHLLFLLDGLTGVRHQPGGIWPLPWRRFTAQPLTPREHWKFWHKPGNVRILSTHISHPKKNKLDVENRIDLFMPENRDCASVWRQHHACSLCVCECMCVCVRADENVRIRPISESSQVGVVHGIRLMIIFCQIAIFKLWHSLYTLLTDPIHYYIHVLLQYYWMHKDLLLNTMCCMCSVKHSKLI